MNNIETEIKEAENEWLKLRYERAGVFESSGLMLEAVKRAVKNRGIWALQTVKQGMGSSVFLPSYDKNRVNLIISLTSTKQRIKYIMPPLKSLIRQTKKADLIVLWLGRGVSYPEDIISGIKGMGITIRYMDDLGPYTKYYHAFREFNNDLIITADDDVIYDERMAEELYREYLKNKNLITARRVHKIRFNAEKKLVNYNDWIWEYDRSGGPSHDLFATGVGGVIYSPEVTSLKIWENKDFLSVCPKADDIWLKFCELSNDIKVNPVSGSRFRNDVIIRKAQKYGLSQNNINKGGNDILLEKCAEYFGMRDDLCERILNLQNSRIK